MVGVVALAAGCATSPPPTAITTGRAQSAKADDIPASPPPPAPTIVPAQTPADAPRVSATTDVVPPVKPDRPRLAWVNPARCVSPCTFHPGDDLRRVNDAGLPDPRGKHRMDAATLTALRDLLDAARTAGHTIRITSAFRSYDDQARLFRTTKEKGRAARPGHSEHQLGSTIDLRLPTSVAIAWLAEHAAAHGFALSYPPGKQRITGYRPEPWHVRFVGREIADQSRQRGGTLEELFRTRPGLASSGTCDDCPAPASRVACGSTTEHGRCEGTVLTWCYQGTLAMVDCAAFSHTCDASSRNGRTGDGSTEGSVRDCVPNTNATETGASER